MTMITNADLVKWEAYARVLSSDTVGMRRAGRRISRLIKEVRRLRNGAGNETAEHREDSGGVRTPDLVGRGER